MAEVQILTDSLMNFRETDSNKHLVMYHIVQYTYSDGLAELRMPAASTLL